MPRYAAVFESEAVCGSFSMGAALNEWRKMCRIVALFCHRPIFAFLCILSKNSTFYPTNVQYGSNDTSNLEWQNIFLLWAESIRPRWLAWRKKDHSTFVMQKYFFLLIKFNHIDSPKLPWRSQFYFRISIFILSKNYCYCKQTTWICLHWQWYSHMHIHTQRTNMALIHIYTYT